LVADEALDENADLPHVRKSLVRLAGWLSQAIEEGRAILSALRASTLEGNNLAEAFRRAVVECQLQYPIECDLTVEGSRLQSTCSMFTAKSRFSTELKESAWTLPP
jgi:signal transduction histidine kinase